MYYEPKEGVLDIEETLNLDKYREWEEKIESDSTLTSKERYYLKLLASRQIEFNYSKIADYYVNAPKSIKNYIEDLRLVILDTDRAIEKGYYKYFEDYNKLIESLVNEK